MNVILYTRKGCHLCDVALKALRQHEVEPTLQDIDESDSLRSEFNECVPVVSIDGKIRFRGKVDPVLLRRLLRNL